MCDFKFRHNFTFVFVFLVYFTGSWNHVTSVEIECIPLISCPTALKIIATAKPEATEFFKISYCGVDEENRPKVWCSKLNFCVTPQNKNGTCTPLRKCKPFLKLKNTLDPSDARAVEFLNKFRCNEILEEQHVCCQNEPVQSENEDGRFRTSRQPNFHHEPMRSDHDLNSDSNYHNYHDDYHSHHKKDSSSAEDMGWDMSRTPLEFGYNKDNRWKESNHIPHRQFDSSYGGNNHRAHHHQKDPEGGFHFLYNSERNGGDSKHYITHDGAYDHITEATTYKRTTSRNRSTTRNHRTTPNNRTQKRKTDEQTTPSTRRTTSNYDSTTTKSTDINRNIGEGDIIFEDTFEDLLERKSRFTTEGTTRSNSQSNKSCETPDGKSGTCTRPIDCQYYITLQNNLDRSKESVRLHLNKFTCNSNGDICCQKDEKNSIDNSLFDVERTNENVPESVSKICGRPKLNTDRIVGGSLTDLGEFPWLALLQYPSNKGIQSGCGGSLINSRYVVTAAHCVDEEILRNRDLRQVRQVVLGEYDTRNKTDCIYMSLGQDCADPAKIYRVESVIAHNMYSSSIPQHDIALLRLDQEVTFTDYVKPICLPTKTLSLKGNETFIIAGWGRTATETFSPVLRKARIRSVGKENCNKRDRSLTDGQICAGIGNGTDSCSGDSGGPLMLQVNVNFEFVTYLVGIISYGFLDCGMGPSVNSYVPYYVDWINANMKL